MRTIKHAVISFGMVAIPVSVAGSTTTTNEPKFRTLHDKCGNPIHEERHCLICGEKVDPDQTLKGYEVAKGQFLTFTQEELDSVSSDRDNTIELTKFVKAADIRPRHVTKSYWLVPPENERLAEKYGLLYQVLAETKKAGLGSESLWGKEFPCAVMPNQDFPGGVLELQVLHLYEDLIAPDFTAPIPGREEKKLAKQLLDNLSGEFDPESDLISDSRFRTNELISARMDKKELPQFGTPVEKETDVQLMDALRASVEEIEKNKTRTKTAPKRKAATKT